MDGDNKSTESELFEVSEKDIYKFTKEFPSDSEKGVPNHFHICVKVKDAILRFNCCTSQSGKVKDRIQFLGSTYVEVTNKKKTEFTEPTFVDCDHIFSMDNSEFEQLVKEGKIEFSGIISGNDYQNIVKGILSSKIVEEETKKIFSE